MTVTAAVVLWGAARLLGWLAQLDGNEVSREAARDVINLPDDYRWNVTAATK